MTTQLEKFVGVMGSGLIGRDPYDDNAWSGSSGYFFRECSAQGILHRAFGVEVDEIRRAGLMLRNFSPIRERWRTKFYLDTTYYELLSKKIAQSMRDSDHAYDVLQIGGIYRLRSVLGAKRRLFSYHDSNLAQALRNPNFPKNLPSRRIRRALDYERSVYDGLDMIFTMSDYLKQTFIDCFGVKKERVRTIGAGLNLEMLPTVPATKAYDNKKLLFVGVDFERKGGYQLLRAFQIVRTAHPDAELYIVGPRRLSIPLALSRGVVYLGFLSKTDPIQMRQFAHILAKASLFVMPSLYEPFGIAPLEAMANCIPAVLSDAWAFPEMVHAGINGELVKLGDVTDLADKVIAMLRDPERLRVMGAAGRAVVACRFTWPAVVRRLKAELADFRRVRTASTLQ